MSKLARLGFLLPLLPVIVAACSTTSPAADENVGAVAQAETAQGDWSDYGSGQCVIGAQTFYKAKFGVALKATGVQSGDVGACAWTGACMYWVSSVAMPDPGTWDRHDWGSAMPQTYDLVIYPPHGDNPYGHVASVDHLSSGDPNDYGALWMMDSNFNGDEAKAPAIHTYNLQPYGFYRLKSLACSDGCDGNTITRSDCSRTDCGGGASCTNDGAGLRCVDHNCPADGDATVCLLGTQTMAECHDGGLSGQVDCSATGAACVTQNGVHCDAPPTGSFDTMGCSTLTGWADDPSVPAQAIDVHLYFGGPAGAPNAVGMALPAATERDDLCGPLGSCGHGFSAGPPRSLLDGQPHEVHAYGIDASGGPNAELGGSPRTLSCPPPTIAPGSVLRRLHDATSFAAWKFSDFADVAPLVDAGSRVDTALTGTTQGPAFPPTPQVVKTDDGASDWWLVDSGLRRKIHGAAAGAWQFATPTVMAAAELYQMPVGPDWADAPSLVKEDGPIYYYVDVAFSAEGTTTAPHGSQSSATTGGPTAASGDAPDGTTARGAMLANNDDSTSCSTSGHGSKSALALGLGLAFGLVFRRRRRAA